MTPQAPSFSYGVPDPYAGVGLELHRAYTRRSAWRRPHPHDARRLTSYCEQTWLTVNRRVGEASTVHGGGRGPLLGRSPFQMSITKVAQRLALGCHSSPGSGRGPF